MEPKQKRQSPLADLTVDLNTIHLTWAQLDLVFFYSCGKGEKIPAQKKFDTKRRDILEGFYSS